MANLYKECVDLLNERGVSLEDIAKETLFLQSKYKKDLELALCIDKVKEVLEDRHIQYATIIAIELDLIGEKEGFKTEAINELIKEDNGLFGVDEIFGVGMANSFGTIAITNFGYIDKIKHGIIGEVNAHKSGAVNTFLDDVIGAIAASAASLIAQDEID